MNIHTNKISIEIFSGLGNVSNVFTTAGWDAWTVDNNPKFNPKLCVDVLHLSRSMLPALCNFIWISVPCTTFSRAANPNHFKKITNKYRNYSYIPLTPAACESISLLRKSIEIINWFPGVPFVIENPVGRIQHMPSMRLLGHYRYFVNYFDFGTKYSKETYLFSNMWLPFETKKYKVFAPGMSTVRSVEKRAEVPAKLATTIFNYLY